MKSSITKFNFLTLLFLALALSFASCSSDNEEEEEQQQEEQQEETAANPQPIPEGVDGALWAVKSVSTIDSPIGPIETIIGLGVAAFFNGGADFVTAGTVSLEGSTLGINPNDSYTYTPSMTEPTGITFQGDVDWSVSGGNGIPAFDRSINIGFPEVDPISSSSTVDLANGYTLTTTNVSGADSVFFSVGGVFKTIPGNATSATFSADELATLSAGSSIVQIAAYVHTSEMISGKDIWFGNETVQTTSVTLE